MGLAERTVQYRLRKAEAAFRAGFDPEDFKLRWVGEDED